MPLSALTLVTPKPYPLFDLKLVIMPPLGFLLMSPFLADDLKWFSISVSSTPSAAAEVIVGVAIDRVPTMK